MQESLRLGGPGRAIAFGASDAMAVGPNLANVQRQVSGTKTAGPSYFDMTDLIEDVLAPTVIKRAISVFENLKERDHGEIVQARKALTPHLFGLITSGQTDEERLLVSALIFLKSLETRARTDKS
jgi:hypothetical protein